jgi:hypothetical protein
MVEKINLDIDYETIARQVIENKQNWINRDNFYTFGAASYLDDTDKYARNIRKSNNILQKEFGGVIKKICDHFSAKTHPEIALPGFHIFDRKSNGTKASIHEDSSYKRLPIFNDNYKDGKSFTILINEPDCGAGLNVWDEAFNKSFYAYELGFMNVHLGGLKHQIANTGDIKKNEYRITLQGHVITFGEETYIYF